MGWFKTTIYPEYWKQYVNSFNKGYSLEHTRFVVFDTETTGLNPKQDRLLSIGTVTIINFKIDVADQLECYIKQEHFNAKTVEIHGILKEGPLDKIEEEE
ncbi:MAG: 3'-5' exonuclease, partial [Flavobacteriaceae bacterium]|nr:3'-5' exonuclease [Flavobacteriaceae bacterium]